MLGISYQQVAQVVNQSDDDWMKFIKSDSDGLTKTGQLLLQKAAEAYVYCILRAQAQTHWQIVGAGAKSLQAQQILEKLVKDTIIQDDDTVTISNMRAAIKNTNVVLNMVISPGIILIPSNMFILKKKLTSYINVLTLATKKMKFGLNRKVNYDPRPKESSDLEHPAQVTPQVTQQTQHNNELGYVLVSIFLTGLIVAKYIF